MKRGQQLGELRLDLSSVELARVLQHAIFGTQMIWSLSARSDLNKWRDMTFEIFWRGIAAEAIPANGARAGSASKEKLL
jgi:hypothetical protein